MEEQRGGRGRGLRRGAAASRSGLEEAPRQALAETVAPESSAPLRAPVLCALRRPRVVEQIGAFGDRLRGGGQQQGANSGLLGRRLTGGCDWHFLSGDFLRFFGPCFSPVASSHSSSSLSSLKRNTKLVRVTTPPGRNPPSPPWTVKTCPRDTQLTSHFWSFRLNKEEFPLLYRQEPTNRVSSQRLTDTGT